MSVQIRPPHLAVTARINERSEGMDSFDMVEAIISGEELVPSIPRKSGKSLITKGNGTLMTITSGGITFSILGGVPGIKKVIFNKPATIILWEGDTKTVVKCGDYEVWDPEKGLAMAIAKKVLGNKGNFNETFKKWIPARRMTKEEKDCLDGYEAIASSLSVEDLANKVKKVTDDPRRRNGVES